MGNRPLIKSATTVGVVFEQFLRLLIYSGLPATDDDMIHCSGSTMRNLVKSSRGPSGGYLLTKCPEEIKLSSIIKAVDERVKTLGCKRESKKGLATLCIGGGEAAAIIVEMI